MTTHKKHIVKLEDQRIIHPFEVDEAYFDHLPQQIQARVVKKPRVVISPFVKIGVGFASILLVLFLINPFQQKTTDVNELLSEVSGDELMAYVEKTHNETISINLNEAIDLAIDNEITLTSIELVSEEDATIILENDDWMINEEELLDELDLEELDLENL